MKVAQLKGVLGQAINKSVEERFKKLDYALLESPFAKRDEVDNAWRCEFWGKIIRSAITAYCTTQDETLGKLLEKTVQAMMATQTGDGCISTYPAERQLGGWDVWGRKYVLLALLRY